MRQKSVSALVEDYLLFGGLRDELDDAIRERHEATLQRLSSQQQELNQASSEPIQPSDGPSQQSDLAATNGVIDQPAAVPQGEGRVPDEDIPW